MYPSKKIYIRYGDNLEDVGSTPATSVDALDVILAVRNNILGPEYKDVAANKFELHTHKGGDRLFPKRAIEPVIKDMDLEVDEMYLVLPEIAAGPAPISAADRNYDLIILANYGNKHGYQTFICLEVPPKVSVAPR